MIQVTLGAAGIELAILVDMNRDVENIRVIVEGLLHAITCAGVRAHTDA